MKLWMLSATFAVCWACLVMQVSVAQSQDQAVDEAIQHHPALEQFLTQDKNERADLASGYAQLAEILAVQKSEEVSEDLSGLTPQEIAERNEVR